MLGWVHDLIGLAKHFVKVVEQVRDHLEGIERELHQLNEQQRKI